MLQSALSTIGGVAMKRVWLGLLTSAGLAFTAPASFAKAPRALGQHAEEFNGVGLVLHEGEQRITVTGIVDGSSAQSDGTIAVGDVIEAVRNGEAAEWVNVSGLT